MEQIKTVEIQDKVFEETYTATSKKTGRVGWGGFRTFQKLSVRNLQKPCC